MRPPISGCSSATTGPAPHRRLRDRWRLDAAAAPLASPPTDSGQDRRNRLNEKMRSCSRHAAHPRALRVQHRWRASRFEQCTTPRRGPSPRTPSGTARARDPGRRCQRRRSSAPISGPPAPTTQTVRRHRLDRRTRAMSRRRDDGLPSPWLQHRPLRHTIACDAQGSSTMPPRAEPGTAAGSTNPTASSTRIHSSPVISGWPPRRSVSRLATSLRSCRT